MSKTILVVLFLGVLAPLGAEAGALRFMGKHVGAPAAKGTSKVVKGAAKGAKAVLKVAAKAIY